MFRNISNGSFLLMPTKERHFVEFAKRDGYNAYFHDLFTSPRRSHVSLHLEWEGWFAKLSDISTLKGKVPVGVLRFLKNANVALLEALAKLCGIEEGFDDKAFLLEARMRTKPTEVSKVAEEEVLDRVLALGVA